MTGPVRVPDVAEVRALLAAATPQRCAARSLRDRLACERDRGHDGAHMHFGTNGTTAWGF